MPRKPTRAQRRAAYYAPLVATAPTPAQALDAAWNWLTAVLAGLEQHDPAGADRARKSLTDQLTDFAKSADPRK